MNIHVDEYTCWWRKMLMNRHVDEWYVDEKKWKNVSGLIRCWWIDMLMNWHAWWMDMFMNWYDHEWHVEKGLLIKSSVY
jgi:hypothetical protein